MAIEPSAANGFGSAFTGGFMGVMAHSPQRFQEPDHGACQENQGGLSTGTCLFARAPNERAMGVSGQLRQDQVIRGARTFAVYCSYKRSARTLHPGRMSIR
jgi:hypothetical protein